ncbi:hypothetical protein KR054_003654, partial [Drosophila jambulina]
MYLGIDFWRRFALAPVILGELTTSNPEASIAEIWDATNPWLDGKAPKESVIEEWNLEEKDKEQLELVKTEFLAFEDVGLGKTTVETHRIQLVEGAEPFKNRHYPQSPAMQEIVWAEVDKMLELGVIEVSESPWSNRTTVALKYLGVVIGGGSLRMDPERAEIPKGTAKFPAKIPEAKNAIQELKTTLTSAPVLVHADFKRPFFVQCDASHHGVGAVLFQHNENKN